MTHRSRISVVVLAVAALAGSLVAAPSQAATSHPATLWPAYQFGNTASEKVTAIIGSRYSTSYTAVGTTTGALPGKTSHGGTDAFIRRITHAGQTTRQYGTAGDDIAYGESGNVEVGSTTGALPGHTNAGGTDGYVWAFKDGKTLWATRLGTSGDDKVVAIDKGHYYLWVVGTTTGAFGGKTNLGGIDYFVARLNPTTGKILNLDQLGTAGDDRAVSITAIGTFVGECCGWEDDVTVSGDTTGTFPDNTSKGGRDLFTMRTGITTGGAELIQFGTPGDDVALAGAGEAIAGYTDGTFAGQTNHGGLDAFVARPGWAYEFGSTADDRATALTATHTTDQLPGLPGYVVAGDTEGTLPGKSAHGGSDTFVLRVDGSSLRWRFQTGSTADDHAYAVASTGRGVIYGGQTFGSLDGGTQRGNGDGFLGRVTWTRPDAAVDYYASGPRPTGANVFGGTSIPFAMGGTAHPAWITADNVGQQPDARRIQGCRSTSVFAVRYLQGDTFQINHTTAKDVTSQVLAGTYRTSTKDSELAAVTAVLRPTKTSKPGDISHCTIRVYSVNNPAIYDDVTLKVLR